MNEQDSVSLWIDQIQQGSEEAAQKIWDTYFPRLVRLAAKKLGTSPQRVSDGEDLALSAMDCFCRKARDGEFSDLKDRDSLWKLLSTITNRKAISLMRKMFSQKRGDGNVRGESVMNNQSVLNEGLAGLAVDLFGPDLIAECEEYLEVLGDGELKQVAVLRIEGYSNLEIAERLRVSTRSVHRRIDRIKIKWRQRLDEDHD